MSVKVMDYVWEMSTARGAARLVLIALADWADDGGFCYPGLAAIVRKTKLSKPGVVKVLRKLEADGELEITVRGHATPDPIKDDLERPGGWQPTNYYRINVGNSVYRPRKRTGGKPRISKVVNPVSKGGKHQFAHIRNEPSLDPSLDPSKSTAARGPADLPALEAFRNLWNEIVTDPIRPCTELTPKRRRLMRACLVERSMATWREVVERIEASSVCHGHNKSGFVMSFDYLIGSPDPAVRVLEGQYDDAFSDADYHTYASQWFNVTGGHCGHEPTCPDRRTCVKRWALAVRAKARRAS